MNETLQNVVDSQDVRVSVEPEKGILRGVRLFDVESSNGRTYFDDAFYSAVELYENLKVNYSDDPTIETRDVGVIRNVVVRPGEGLFADFHFHRKDQQLDLFSKHVQEFGFSHIINVRTARHGDRAVVEAIIKVQSVIVVWEGYRPV